MASGIVFITGATGFIGAATALEALQAGYSLRISVRRAAQIEKLKKIFSSHAGKVEFVIVPDITAEDSFTGKLDGVDYVLHLASPLPSGTDKEHHFKPAVEGTMSILKAATKVPSIKKVVVTSSIVALVPLGSKPGSALIKEDADVDLSINPDDDFNQDNDLATAFALYAASKLLANNASWDYIEKEKPHYNLITIHPSFVYGHSLVQESEADLRGSTNGLLFNSIMTGYTGSPINCVHVRDVAEAHIRSLSPGIKGSTKYLIDSPSLTWEDVVKVLEKDYPTAGWKLKADAPTLVWKADTTKAETELGVKWRSIDHMVHEVMDQQLEFLKLAAVASKV